MSWQEVRSLERAWLKGWGQGGLGQKHMDGLVGVAAMCEELWTA